MLNIRKLVLGLIKWNCLYVHFYFLICWRTCLFYFSFTWTYFPSYIVITFRSFKLMSINSLCHVGLYGLFDYSICKILSSELAKSMLFSGAVWSKMSLLFIVIQWALKWAEENRVIIIFQQKLRLLWRDENSAVYHLPVAVHRLGLWCCLLVIQASID